MGGGARAEQPRGGHLQLLGAHEPGACGGHCTALLPGRRWQQQHVQRVDLSWRRSLHLLLALRMTPAHLTSPCRSSSPSRPSSRSRCCRRSGASAASRTRRCRAQQPPVPWRARHRLAAPEAPPPQPAARQPVGHSQRLAVQVARRQPRLLWPRGPVLAQVARRRRCCGRCSTTPTCASPALKAWRRCCETSWPGWWGGCGLP